MQKFDLEKFNNYNQLVRKLPIGAISLGSFVHEDLKLNPKAPFIGPVRKTCLSKYFCLYLYIYYLSWKDKYFHHDIHNFIAE